MRSPSELLFRVRQEFANAALYMLPPETGRTAVHNHATFLPRPDAVTSALAATPYRDELHQRARGILGRRLPLLGLEIEVDTEIHWRRDYASGLESGTEYFRWIRYLEPALVGDHKVIWELNRHQHLVLLAQEFLFGREEKILAEVVRQLESWMTANPFQCGINWASALEVGFRALSWIWIWHLIGDRFDAAFRNRFLTALYRHGSHLEHNLSFYFSPNTHLLGEALALHALAIVFPQWPRSSRWRVLGRRTVYGQMDRQVRLDGSYFEQSAYYHVYALDMFLFEALIEAPEQQFVERLAAMANYLDYLLGSCRLLPMFGDDDGGRFFYPYGDRSAWPRQSLAACGRYLKRPEWIRCEEDLAPLGVWWLRPAAAGPAPLSDFESKLFEPSGMASLFAADRQVLFDCGPFGPGSAGHSHSDTLGLIVRSGNEEILIDPATYTYIGDPVWRSRFRGSAAHNTIKVGGMDQAIEAGPFAWRGAPVVRLLEWHSSAGYDRVAAECRYAGLCHSRQVHFFKPDVVLVIDEISDATAAERVIEQFWHPGVAVTQTSPASFLLGQKATLTVSGGPAILSEGGEYGWKSPVFGAKTKSPLICVTATAQLPYRMAAAIEFDQGHACSTITLVDGTVRYCGVRTVSVNVSG